MNQLAELSTPASPVTFAESFKHVLDVHHYEENVYSPDGFDSFVWSLQRPVLLHHVRQLRAALGRISYLDFACGTGRIVSAVEELTDRSVAIDVSEGMIALARPKVRRSELVVGDLLHDPTLVSGPFDVITAFRFFLNVEPQLRLSALTTLAQLMRGAHSRLIFNVHGNRHSVRHMGIERRRRRGEIHNEMSLAEITRLVRQAGLTIESSYGYGILPRRLHSGICRGWVRTLDRWAAGRQALKGISQDLLFVCRRS